MGSREQTVIFCNRFLQEIKLVGKEQYCQNLKPALVHLWQIKDVGMRSYWYQMVIMSYVYKRFWLSTLWVNRIMCFVAPWWNAEETINVIFDPVAAADLPEHFPLPLSLSTSKVMVWLLCQFRSYGKKTQLISWPMIDTILTYLSLRLDFFVISTQSGLFWLTYTIWEILSYQAMCRE